MANVFNAVKGLHPKRNAFSAHTYRNDFTSSLGVNIPVYLQHVPPASRVRVQTSALVRLQALIAPVMDNIDLYVHFWQIPYRLLENDVFTQFISGEILPEEYDGCFFSPQDIAKSIADVLYDYYRQAAGADVDALYSSIVGNGSLFDFLGYDTSCFPESFTNARSRTGGLTKNVNWRELIAYYMVHKQWYMNENVPYFDEFIEWFDAFYQDQTDIVSLAKIICKCQYLFRTTLLPHGWEKDYFTSALPSTQYGAEVRLPMAGTAPVTIDPATLRSPMWFGELPDSVASQPLIAHFASNEASDSDSNMQRSVMTGHTSNANLQDYDNNLLTGVYARNGVYVEGNITGSADLSEASAININEFRFAYALQVFKEREMRYGRRRIEHYKGFFDVVPEDLRLQIPKYLGGGRIPINIADIEQTSQTSSNQPLGRLAGKATAVAGGFAGFSTFCSEETVIIGIAFAMPHITYANGMSRWKFKTIDYYDYFNPGFQHLGEQAILNAELYAGTDEPDGEFAYTPRYNEYRFHANEMHGAFKDSLAFWTLGRIFADTPALNANFIYMQPSVFNRIFAVNDSQPMLASFLFRQRIIQPVSKWGTPMLLS